VSELQSVIKLAAASLGVALAACGSDPTTPEDSAHSIVIRLGDLQSAPAGSIAGEPLLVTVKDVGNQPVAGAIVKFRVRAGSPQGTQLSDTVATSGVDGIAGTTVRLGSALDTSRVDAFLPSNTAAQVTFRVVGTAPATLTAVTPSTIAPGDTVTLTGTHFSSLLEANTVLFGSARARVLSGTADTQLRVVVPPCLPAGAVQVRVAIGSAVTSAVAATSQASATVLDIAPLTGITVSGTELGNCLRLPGSGATYLLVPQSASSSDGLRRIDYVLGATTVTLDALPPSKSGVPLRPLSPVVPPAAPTSQQQIDATLRALEHDLVRAGGPRVPQPTVAPSVAPPAPRLGTTRSFQVLSNLDGTAFKGVTAALRYAGDHILIYVDRDMPAGGFTDAELEPFGDLFDQTFYELDARTFGAESDIDRNGRVIVLMTPVVNAITPASQCASLGFVTGFFFGLDLLPERRSSNKGEVFYSLVPDQSGSRSCQHSKAQVLQNAPTTFVHELQHMISFNQHVLVRAGSDEAVWLNEGLSHVAEELASKYYEDRYPSPAGRTDAAQLFPDSSQSFIVPDISNAFKYLAASTTTSVTTTAGSGSLQERGAAWIFLRWLGDHFGDGIFARLVQTGRTGTDNVADKAGESFASLFGDFATAVYTDSIAAVPRTQIPLRLRFTSRNFRQIFARFASLGNNNSGITSAQPINPKPFAPGMAVTGSFLLGTMDYAQLITTGGVPPVAIRFSRPDLSAFAPNDEVQLGVFRLK
jgi:IPT/TIG domain-containing protein